MSQDIMAVESELRVVCKSLYKHMQLLGLSDIYNTDTDDMVTFKNEMVDKIFNQEVRFKTRDGSDFSDWTDDVLGNRVSISEGNRFVNMNAQSGRYPIYGNSINVSICDHYDFDVKAIVCSSNADYYYPLLTDDTFALGSGVFAMTPHNYELHFIKALLESKENYFLDVGSDRLLTPYDFNKCPVETPCLDELVLINHLFELLDGVIGLQGDIHFLRMDQLYNKGGN